MCIYELHLYSHNSAYLSLILDKQFQAQTRSWASVFHTWLIYPPTDALRPVIPDNAWDLRITAAAGT